MSFREKVKESYKQAKGDLKSFFKLPGVTGDTRPNTPSGTRPHAGPLRPDKQVDNPTTSGFESPSSAQVSTSQLMTTPRNDAPKVQNELEQSPQPNRFVGQVHSDATNPVGFNCQVSGADVETNTDTAVVSEPQGIEPPDQGVVPATSHDQKEECLAIGGQPSVEVSRVDSAPESVKWKALKQFAAVLEPATNIFGPIKDVATLFLECVDKCEMAGEAQSEYEALRVRLEGIFGDLQVHFSEGHSLTMTPSMENLCKSIQEELNYIKLQKDRNLGGRYLAAPDDADKILACYRRIEGYIHRLLLNVNMTIYKVVHEQAADSRADRIFSRVDRLPSALPAWYDSAEGIELKRRGCTSGTRVDVLASILAWANNKTGGGVYWLNGMAGTGKTTIAYSVCAELSKGHQLAASFFCSRLREECRNVNNIIPSIAYQLAQFSRPFQSALSAVLEKDPNLHGRLPHMQFDALIARPILEVQHTLPECMVAVIDALDECEQKESTGRVLDVLLSKSVSLPIKFLVSSRPESEIRDQMTDDRAKSRLVLHELDKGEVQADIERYLREGLSLMNPSDLQITKLVEKAGILFIYAATAVRYISFDNFRSDPHDRLRTILKGSPSSEDKESEEIDQLYMTVLEAALGNPRLRKIEQDNMRQVLHTVICARDSLTVPGLSDLLQINSTDRVRAALRPLWSVLHVVGSSELVTTLHASFPDFMFDLTRSKAYYCDSPSHNHTLSKHCLELIEQTQPQFNICQLESSYISDEKVPNIEERVNQAISSGLLYACRYWADHLSTGVGGSGMAKLVQGFLSMRLLLWMEVLNLGKHMKAGMECMTCIVEWCNNIEDQELVELAIDVQRFVDAFALNPISHSTPHIYLSMLPFWPRFRPVS